MLKIESIELIPLPEYPEVKISIARPTYSQKIAALMEAKSAPADGPDTAEVASYWPYLARLITDCVKKVEGVEVDGKELKTGADLVAHAPQEIMDPLILKISEMVRINKDLKKKS